MAATDYDGTGNTSSAIRRFKKRSPIQKAERYRLVVSGIVTYGPEDSDLRDLLLETGEDRAKLPEALQELEEEANDVKIVLERLS